MKKYIIPVVLLITYNSAFAQSEMAALEEEFYRLESVTIPPEILLEVGGMDFHPDGRLAVCTRRGEIWLIDGLYPDQKPEFTLFASGLHEPLGLSYQNGVMYVTQRSEITRLIDVNKDNRADRFETVYSWPLTGNYHEYSYGPKFLPDGSMLVTLNLGWEGKGVSKAKWRGWFLRVFPDGRMIPWATGLRSPAGFNFNDQGDLFYAENQGDWVGSGRISHVERGDFLGNPAGLNWAGEKLSPVNVALNQITDSLGTMYDARFEVESVKPPAVWFPHGIMGISTADITTIPGDGSFGPFENQLLVSDQGQSKLMRVYLEKVLGVYQGACFPFREGYASGLLRLAWGKNSTLFGGMTSRGWQATGRDLYGLQRLSWTGKVPFEMNSIKIQADGFLLEFTKPVKPETLKNLAQYNIKGFTYKYHHVYGSPAIHMMDCPIVMAEPGPDGKTVKLTVDGLRAGYVHEVKITGMQAADGSKLLHDVGYYTINRIPGGKEFTGNLQMVAGTSGTEFKLSDKRVTEIPADWNGKVDQEVTISTKMGMVYDTELVEVKAGSKVKLTLHNPDDMQHNLLIIKPGSLEKVAEEALALGLEGIARNHVPNSDLVLYHTRLLEPETSESIYFKVPEEPGDYIFVCTVPGHAMSMNGIFRVSKTVKLVAKQ